MLHRSATPLLLLLTLTASLPAGLRAADTPGAGTRSYTAIDAVALEAPPEAERDMAMLVRYLTATAADDREKARAIFRWIAHRIDYDAEAFFRGSVGFATPEDVFRQRKAVCGGFTRLFTHMGRMAGLEVVTISGRAKAFDPRTASQTSVQKHAWNAVRLDGDWHTLDVTWAAGHLSGRSFVRSFDDFWFLTPPEQKVFSHLPPDPKWQRLARPISAGEFRKLPRVRSSTFDLGFSPQAIRTASRARRFPGVVETFAVPVEVRVRKAAVSRVLTAGIRADFAIDAPRMEEIVLVDGDRWHHMQREGDTFSVGVVPPEAGRLIVMGRPTGAEEFATFLVYEVRAAPVGRKGKRAR